MDVLPSRISQYEIRRVLGKGGMGVVYLAFDPALHRQIALKVLRTDSDDQRERFRREARTVARLQHPNIVAIYAVGEHEQQPFIAMEYIEGEPLSEGIRRRAPWGLHRKLLMGADLCAGLAFAHRAGVVHRDVKPSNLIVANGSGAIRLLDFGIARGTDPAGTLGLTMHGNIVGTLNYMSPEQITGQPIDHRSDVFAVGLVLYELVTYRQAFPGDNLATLTYRIVHGSPEPIRSIQPDADPGLCAVIERAMARHVDDRYPHLDAMRGDLLAVAARLDPAQAATLAPPAAADGGATGSAPAPIWSHALDVTAPASGPLTPRSTARVPDARLAATVDASPARTRPTWAIAVLLGGLVVGSAGVWFVVRPGQVPAESKVERPTDGVRERPDEALPPHVTKEGNLAAGPAPSGPAQAAPEAAQSPTPEPQRPPAGVPRPRDEPAARATGASAAGSRTAAVPTAQPIRPVGQAATSQIGPRQDPAATAAARDLPAVTAPAETRAAVPPPPTPPAGPSDEDAIRGVLDRWARAYAARDARGVDDVQPGAAATLEKQFADLRSVQVSLSGCRISVRDAAATADCAEQFAAETRFGGKSNVGRRRHFSLQKSGDQWRITGTRVG